MGNKNTSSATWDMAEDESDQNGHRLTDMELIGAVRAGNEDAYAELWARHYASAVRVARSITTTFDPDDLAQEAFASLLIAIRRGGGPRTAFRAYLMTSVKNVAMTWGRTQREVATEDLESHFAPIDSDLEKERQIDSSITKEAFLSLPERWQRVLWHTEIEEMSTAEVADLMGIKPGAVAQLAFRAREALRESWLSSHLRVTKESTDECRWLIKRAGAYARGNSSTRDTVRIEKHLGCCPSCPDAFKEAQSVNRRLLTLLPPIAGAGTAISAVTAVTGAESAVATIPGTSTGTGAIFPPSEWSEPVRGSTGLASIATGKSVLTASAAVIALVAAASVMITTNANLPTEPGTVAAAPLLKPELDPAPGTPELAVAVPLDDTLPNPQPTVEAYVEIENPREAPPPRSHDPASGPAPQVHASAKPTPTSSTSPTSSSGASAPQPAPSASTTTPAISMPSAAPPGAPEPTDEITSEPRQPLATTLRVEYVEGGVKYLRLVFSGEPDANVGGYLDGVEQIRIALDGSGTGKMLLILPLDSLPHATAAYL